MKPNKEIADYFITSFLYDLTIDESKLEDEKKIVEQELLLTNQGIFNQNKKFLYKTLGNTGQTILGSKKTLQEITLEDIKNAHSILKKNYVIVNSEGYTNKTLKSDLKEEKTNKFFSLPIKALLVDKARSDSALITFAFYLPKEFELISDQFFSYFYKKLFFLLREKYQLVYRGEKNKILTAICCLYSFSFQIDKNNIENIIQIFDKIYKNIVSSINILEKIKENSLIEKHRNSIINDNPLGYVKQKAMSYIMENRQNNLNFELLMEKLIVYTPSIVIKTNCESISIKGFELYEI